MRLYVYRTGRSCQLPGRDALVRFYPGVLRDSLHESQEKGMWAIGAGKELGMELRRQHERVVCQLGDLYQLTIRRYSRENHATLRK